MSAAREYPGQPVVAIGVVVIEAGRVLLVRRGRPPSKGLWAVPGGRVELGETLAEAAAREVFEETGVRVADAEVVWGFDAVDRDDDGRVRHHYVVVDLRARFVSGNPRAGDDADEAAWIDAAGLRAMSDVSEPTRHLLFDRLAFGDSPGA